MAKKATGLAKWETLVIPDMGQMPAPKRARTSDDGDASASGTPDDE